MAVHTTTPVTSFFGTTKEYPGSKQPHLTGAQVALNFNMGFFYTKEDYFLNEREDSLIILFHEHIWPFVFLDQYKRQLNRLESVPKWDFHLVFAFQFPHFAPECNKPQPDTH
jgi:hypothetical protein